MKRTLYVMAWLVLALIGYTGWRNGWLLGSILPNSQSPAATAMASPTLSVASFPPSVASRPAPSAVVQNLPTNLPTVSPSISASSSPTALARKVSLSVPFTIQAPDSEWVEPWKEGCEEAALLMVDAYLRGHREDRLPIAETKQKIAAMVAWQETRFGGHFDLGLSDIAAIAREYMGYKKIRVVKEADFTALREELAAGHPIILPAAGQRLGNPHFVQPGPLYHVFVLTGYEENNFIVNENGTRVGRGYRYSKTILEDAWHDYDSNLKSVSGGRSYLVLER